MFNEIIDIGDADGEGHEIKLTIFDDGSLIVSSRNPDSDDVQQVVLMPQQWRELMRLLIGTCGNAVCPYHRPPNVCEQERSETVACDY